MNEIEIKDKREYLENKKILDYKYDEICNCLHCGEDIRVSDFKVFKEGKKELICCPNAPECDGTMIDWMDPHYNTFVTISSRNKYDEKFWLFFLNHIITNMKLQEPIVRLKYLIEDHSNGSYLQFITSFEGRNKILKLIKDELLFDSSTSKKEFKTNNSSDLNIKIKKAYDVIGLEKLKKFKLL